MQKYIVFDMQADLEDMEELLQMRSDLMDHTQNIMNCAVEYINTFEKFSFLWIDDRNEFMRQFLLYNHVLTSEEIDSHRDDGVPETPPTLAQFRQQVRASVKQTSKTDLLLVGHLM